MSGKMTRQEAIAHGLLPRETMTDTPPSITGEMRKLADELRGAQAKKAIICDLDGTLALMGERKPFDWHLVGNDAPNKPVIDLVKRYSIDHGIFIVSGRSEECRVQTVRWLKRHQVPCLCLFMRKANDYRKDAVVKREIWEQQVMPMGYQITFALDDRNQSVEFWRSLGLTCLQVAEGDF